MSHRINVLTKIFLCSLFFVSINGCGKSIVPPYSTWVEVNFNISNYINPNTSGRPSPIVVRIYELRSPSQFNSAEFFDIYDREKESLDTSLVSKVEFEFQPNEKFALERQLSKDTRYLGVIAAFRDIDNATWRDVIQVKQRRTNKLQIVIQDNNIQFSGNGKN